MISSVRGRIGALGAAALCAVVSGCQITPAPSPTSGTRIAAPTSAPPATSRPLTTPRPSPPDLASVQIQLLDPRYVPANASISADDQILWTAGTHWVPEIWRFTPGSGTPERIFASPRSKANITEVVASAGGYAFVEESEPAFGEGGWRVWYLPRPGAEPIELDRGIAKEAGFPPTLAMDDTRIVWAGFDEPSTGWVTRVRMAAISDPGHVTTLVERPVDDSLIWYPALHRDELWFSTIHPNSDPTAEGPEYNLEILDLSDPRKPPEQFDGTGHDFNPAVNEDYVVWKANRRGDAALNWGSLKILDRRSNDVRTIAGNNANRPSIGRRFVTFDELFHRTVPIYDTGTHTLLDLAPRLAGETRGLAFGGESLSGSLLTFSFGPVDVSKPPRIGWAMLPE